MDEEERAIAKKMRMQERGAHVKQHGQYIIDDVKEQPN